MAGSKPPQTYQFYFEIAFIGFGFFTAWINSFLNYLNSTFARYLSGVLTILLIYCYLDEMRRIFLFFASSNCEELTGPFQTQCFNQRWTSSLNFLLEFTGLILTFLLLIASWKYFIIKSKAEAFFGDEEEEQEIEGEDVKTTPAVFILIDEEAE